MKFSGEVRVVDDTAWCWFDRWRRAFSLVPYVLYPPEYFPHFGYSVGYLWDIPWSMLYLICQCLTLSELVTRNGWFMIVWFLIVWSTIIWFLIVWSVIIWFLIVWFMIVWFLIVWSMIIWFLIVWFMIMIVWFLIVRFMII
jgi:hypothetical protein